MAADNEESGFAQSIFPRQSGQVFWSTAQLTLAALKAIISTARRHLQICFVLENQGLYYYDENNTSAESSPTIISPDDADGRWILIFAIGSGVLTFNQADQPPLIEGAQWYDSVNKQWKGCNGSDWDTVLG